MKEHTIDSLINLIKTIDTIKQNKKMSEIEKLEMLFTVFGNVPLDIKAQLYKMKPETIKGMVLPKDFKASEDGRYIESEQLDMDKYDDLLITVSGNFLDKDRKKLTDLIVYKLNH